MNVLCLRPEADLARLDAMPPRSLTVTYLAPDDPSLPVLIKDALAGVAGMFSGRADPATVTPAVRSDGSAVRLTSGVVDGSE